MIDRDYLETLKRRLDTVEKELTLLKNNSTPTVPIYDETQFPIDAVEGQIALGNDGLAYKYQGGTWTPIGGTDDDPYIPWDGWIVSRDTWTVATAPGPANAKKITCSSGIDGISVGMRVKVISSSSTGYFIVTYINGSNYYLYGRSTLSGTISALWWSPVKHPKNFPVGEDKWSEYGSSSSRWDSGVASYTGGMVGGDVYCPEMDASSGLKISVTRGKWIIVISAPVVGDNKFQVGINNGDNGWPTPITELVIPVSSESTPSAGNLENSRAWKHIFGRGFFDNTGIDSYGLAIAAQSVSSTRIHIGTGSSFFSLNSRYTYIKAICSYY